MVYKIWKTSWKNKDLNQVPECKKNTYHIISRNIILLLAHLSKLRHELNQVTFFSLKLFSSATFLLNHLLIATMTASSDAAVCQCLFQEQRKERKKETFQGQEHYDFILRCIDLHQHTPEVSVHQCVLKLVFHTYTHTCALRRVMWVCH